MHLKVKILFLICLSTSLLCLGQVEDTVVNMVDYHQEMAGQVFLHTSGIGINFRRATHVTAYKKRMLDMDLCTMAHPKSYVIPSSQINNSLSFVYGELNSLLLLRAGYGVQKVIASKSNKSHVEIRMLYAGGLSLCFLKPSYFEIESSGNTKVFEKFTNANKSSIKGGAPFSHGFNELSLMPGAYGKMGLSFEYGGALEKVRAIETGIVVDVYYKDVPILASTKNYPFFVSIYLGVVYGKKWYR